MMKKIKLKKLLILNVLFLFMIFSLNFSKNVYASTTKTEWTCILKTTLSGAILSDGDLSFTITSTNGGPLPSNTIAKNIGGFVYFDPINYSESDVGKTYTYNITENADPYYVVQDKTYVVSVTISKDSNGNIIAKENKNILKGTNNPGALELDSDWTSGGWELGSSGNGTASIYTSDDTPTGENTVFKISNNTNGNKDFQQKVVPFETGEVYVLSGYVKVPDDSCFDFDK